MQETTAEIKDTTEASDIIEIKGEEKLRTVLQFTRTIAHQKSALLARSNPITPTSVTFVIFRRDPKNRGLIITFLKIISYRSSTRRILDGLPRISKIHHKVRSNSV